MTKQCVGVVMIATVIINDLTKQFQTFFNFCKDDLLSASETYKGLQGTVMFLP